MLDINQIKTNAVSLNAETFVTSAGSNHNVEINSSNVKISVGVADDTITGFYKGAKIDTITDLVLNITNVSSDVLTLKHNTGSTVGKRLYFWNLKDLIISKGQSVTFIYADIAGTSYWVKTNDAKEKTWTPPKVSFSQGSFIGVTVVINDDNSGKYYSFDGSSDDLGSFDWDLENNNIPYDGSDLKLELFGRLSAAGIALDTVGWIVEYAFCKDGDDLSTGKTAIAQNNVDVSDKALNVGFYSLLDTMEGVAGATMLRLTITRNSTGAGADAFAGNWEGFGLKLKKV